MIRQPLNRPIGKRNYELVEEYVCPVSGTIVPAGFIYDGASVNRILWTLTGIRPDGPYRAGATVHDYLYRHGGRVRVRDGEMEKWANFSRGDADRIFRDLMAGSDVSSYRSTLAWCGVRLFGWMGPWKTNKQG